MGGIHGGLSVKQSCRCLVLLVVVVCMQQALLMTNAQSDKVAMCKLLVRGHPHTGGIIHTGLQCIGGNVTVAVDETLLGKFKINFKGVTWDEQHCGSDAKGCLLTVCGNTRAIFLDSFVKGVKAVLDGGMICVTGKSQVEIVNTTVAFNAATGIVVENSTVSIAGNASIMHNNASGDGGGVYVGSNSIVSISGNASITYNHASGYGGGVWVGSNSTVSIVGNASIAHNIATPGHVDVYSKSQGGGGVCVDSNSTVSIAGNTSITHNIAISGHGGGVYVGDNSNVSIAGNVSITHNKEVVRGGGMYVGDKSNVSIAGNVSITHNKALSGGGMSVSDKSNVSIAGDASIMHNHASRGDGGGVYVSDNSNVSIAGNTSIMHNNASNVGGGVYVASQSNVIIASNTSIMHNHAYGSGGGVCVRGHSNVSIAGNASIMHNNADPAGPGINGMGGGMYVGEESNVSIDGNTSITHNKALSRGDGGGVYVDGRSNVSIAGKASIMHNNATIDGGGVYVGGNSTVIIAGNASITHNNVSRDGGGLVVSYKQAIVDSAMRQQGVRWDPSTLHIVGNASITHNKALGDAGGVYVGYNSIVSIGGNVSIMHNTAYNDGGCMYMSRHIHASISGLFTNCIGGGEGGALWIRAESNVSISGAHFSHNHANRIGDDVFAAESVGLSFLDNNIDRRSPSVYWQRTDCALGEIKGPHQQYCTACPINMYSLNVANTACDPCPPHAYCPGGDVLLPIEGHWHSHKYSTQMHKCLKATTCIANGTCAPGYEGNLCGRCSPGNGSVGAFTCGPCRSVSFTVAVYVVTWWALVVLVAILVYTTVHDNLQQTRSLRPSDLLKVLIRHVQYLIMIFSIRMPWSNTLAYLFRAIAWVFSASTAPIVSLDCVLQYVHSDVPTAIAKTLINLLTPVTVFVAVLLLRMLVRSVHRCTWYVCTLTELVVASLVVMFFFYPVLVQTSLGMFACIKVDNAQLPSDPYPQYAIANASHGYWMWDMQQACGEGWHLRWSLGLGLPYVLCFCVLVPVGMLALLYHNRARLDASSVKSNIGFLYHCFTARMYYWEAVATVQTIFVVVVSTYSFSLGAYHAALLMLVCFLAIVATQYVYKPFAFKEVQHMQLFSNICLVLTVMIGMSLFESADVVVPVAYKEVICAVGLIINVAFMCWCACKVGLLQLTEVRKWVSLGMTTVKGWMGKRSKRVMRS